MLQPTFHAPALADTVQTLARAIAALPQNPRFAQKPRAFLVGGCVRDAWLGEPSKDADVEVYGVEPAKLEQIAHQLFPTINTIGQSFAVLKVSIDGSDLDISIPRRESKSGRGHKGFIVESDPDLSFEDACRRRDFTINAMLLDPLDGTFIDPFNGQAYLESNILRVVDPERFQDDPLRVYRAMQLTARFAFAFDPQSFGLMKEMAANGSLADLSRERITDEFRKLFLRARIPSIGLNFLREIGVIASHYPELHALIGTPQEPEWHPEGDVWIHSLMALDQAAKIVKREGLDEETSLHVMLGTLCHDLGKPSTTAIGEKDGKPRIRSLGHEEAGEEPTKSLLARWTFGEKAEQAAVASAKEHLKPGMLFQQLQKGSLTEETYANAVRKLLKRIYPVSWRVLLACSEADHRGRALPGAESEPYASGIKFTEAVTQLALDREPPKPLLQGRDLLDLGLKPGKYLGELINAAENLRDEGKLKTKEEALAWFKAKQNPTE